jgi:F-box domain
MPYCAPQILYPTWSHGYLPRLSVHLDSCTTTWSLWINYHPKSETKRPPPTSAMRENITTLPTEVTEEITSYMSYSDIAALARTSKRLCLVAASKLRGFIPPLTAQRMRMCIQHLASDSQRAAEILEIHLPKLMRREERRKPSPWRFDSISGVLSAAIERVLPLPFVPVETYFELGAVFKDALRNMTNLRVLVVHSLQYSEILDENIIIPSLREIFVHPGAESWHLWRWATRQDSLTTLQCCWSDPNHTTWWFSGPTYHGLVIFANLETLITDPEGAAELLPKSAVSDLTIQFISNPPSLSMYSDRKPPFLEEIVCSNQRAPLHRITLAGVMTGVYSVLKELRYRDSLPPRVRLFFVLEQGMSERDLVRQSP